MRCLCMRSQCRPALRGPRICAETIYWRVMTETAHGDCLRTLDGCCRDTLRQMRTLSIRRARSRCCGRRLSSRPVSNRPAAVKRHLEARQQPPHSTQPECSPHFQMYVCNQFSVPTTTAGAHTSEPAGSAPLTPMMKTHKRSSTERLAERWRAALVGEDSKKAVKALVSRRREAPALGWGLPGVGLDGLLNQPLLGIATSTETTHGVWLRTIGGCTARRDRRVYGPQAHGDCLRTLGGCCRDAAAYANPRRVAAREPGVVGGAFKLVSRCPATVERRLEAGQQPPHSTEDHPAAGATLDPTRMQSSFSDVRLQLILGADDYSRGAYIGTCGFAAFEVGDEKHASAASRIALLSGGELLPGGDSKSCQATCGPTRGGPGTGPGPPGGWVGWAVEPALLGLATSLRWSA